MLKLAMSYLHNQSDAEDIVHDVFLNIAQKNMEVIKRITEPEDIRNYLLKATKNKALNNIRNAKKRNLFLEQISATLIENTENIPDKDFIESINNVLEYECILNAIKSLKQKYQSVLYYHYVLEMSVSDVAKL